MAPYAAGASTPASSAASSPTLPASGPIQTIYILPSSHWDLGFIRPPLSELDAIKPHLDAVLSACEADPQFRWTIESVWQLQAWFDRTQDPAQIQRMTRLLHSGQIELSAAYGSMHTEFMGSEELNRLIADGASIEQRFGVHPKVAMMNDVPGFSLRVPQVLARSDVPYVITGLNTALGGGTQVWPGKVPFYWESPDGSRVLTWQTQSKNGGYTEGLADYYLAPQAEDPYFHTRFYPKEWTGLSDLEIMQRGVDKLVKTYTDAGYSRSILAVLFMHDGIGPDYELKGLLPSVRAWNAAGRSPRLVVANPSEFFAALEKEGVHNAPTFKGDWSGLWSEVKLNSPAMSADARALQELLPQTESLWSVLKMKHTAATYPGDALHSDWNALFVYDEHNGAGQGGWPKVLSRAEVLEQNKEYADALRAGIKSAEALRSSGIEKLAPASVRPDSHRALLVFNPQSWTRSQSVRVPPLQGSWQVRDAGSGAVIASQRLASGDLSFQASDMPSFGYRTYWLEPSAATAPSAPPADPAVLESPYFKVELNPVTGSILRITDLRNHRVLLDERDGGHAGTLMQNAAAVAEPAERVELHREKGPVVDQVVIRRPGSIWPQTIIALPQQEPVVRLDEVLDRSKMRFVGKGDPRAMYSFAFDFSFQGKVQRWVADGQGLYRFPNDLLPGARQDAAVPRHTLVWSEEKGASSYHVMLAQKQAFFDRYATPGAAPSGAHTTDGVRADVMIKVDQAETRDTGVTTFETYEPGYPGTYNFSFALTGDAGPADPIAAHHFEVQDDSDFVALAQNQRPATWPTSLLSTSLLSIDAPNVVLDVLKPSADGKPNDYLLRLQEIAGKPTVLSIHLPVPVHSIDETTLTEERVLRSGIKADAIHIAPYQTLTLRLTAERQPASASGEKH